MNSYWTGSSGAYWVVVPVARKPDFAGKFRIAGHYKFVAVSWWLIWNGFDITCWRFWWWTMSFKDKNYRISRDRMILVLSRCCPNSNARCTFMKPWLSRSMNLCECAPFFEMRKAESIVFYNGSHSRQIEINDGFAVEVGRLLVSAYNPVYNI